MTAVTHAPRNHWDVIVFGAGPAGSALARRLAGQHRVLLIDREAARETARGRARPVEWRIGESLPGAAAVLLRRQGLFEQFLADGHAERCASVSVWDDDAPVWFDAMRDPNGPGWHLDRVRFDAMLRKGALDAGVKFATGIGSGAGRISLQRTGNTWQIAHGDARQAYTAEVIVDATGRSAALCRSLGMRRKSADRLVCLHALFPALPGDVDRSTRTCADKDGWWYSVRVPSGRRVLAYHLDADDPALRERRDIGVMIEQARQQPLLSPVLPKDVPHVKTHVRPSGSASLDLADCANRPGVYAVGDAMLAFDPLSSQGLFHALASAESAAAAIARQLAGDSDASRCYFDEMWQVQARYDTHLATTYAGPHRYAERQFWVRRSS
ncbi:MULTISPECIES: NAD(P)/FAD-dependent oxidoreductase [unclassified Paraburkholderia]|uniref:NAD(P)/FAD-dependent oxidoreductase n=1 Tax=unclassified Paraburkholderia TaxID=2615204 RepID=UPI002AB133DE|nr:MULTISPECIES: tryptophan 7-halogenase [unclassified Paraburkholderia]